VGDLGALLAAKGLVRTAGTHDAPAPAPAPRDAVDVAASPKIVLRIERKGHGGKTTTIVEGIVGSDKALDEFARDLKRGLGVGVSVDEARLVVQGDQRDRLKAFLEARGARRIV
jgi:translation initiation factor 1 (eIF-1/SUI1)